MNDTQIFSDIAVSGNAFGSADWSGLIEPDVLARFEGCAVMHGDLINAQLIVELRKLREALKERA